MQGVFNSLLGQVKISDIVASLSILLEGMVGIFIVMLLIYLTILILSKVFGSGKKIKK